MYVELADQYKVMDAVSDVYRRNILAQHLREVIDILEQKVCSVPTLFLHGLTFLSFQGDQIVSLYSLLSFRDKEM